MKRRVLCLLAPGFEEMETVAPVDLLRRAGAEVVTASLSSNAGGRGHFRHVHPVKWPKDEMAVVRGYGLLMLSEARSSLRWFKCSFGL